MVGHRPDHPHVRVGRAQGEPAHVTTRELERTGAILVAPGHGDLPLLGNAARAQIAGELVVVSPALGAAGAVGAHAIDPEVPRVVERRELRGGRRPLGGVVANGEALGPRETHRKGRQSHLRHPRQLASPDVVGGVGGQEGDQRIDAAGKRSLPHKVQAILAAARCGADPRNQQVDVGVAPVLRPQRKGQIGDEEVPIARGVLAVQEHAQACVGDGRCRRAAVTTDGGGAHAGLSMGQGGPQGQGEQWREQQRAEFYEHNTSYARPPCSADPCSLPANHRPIQQLLTHRRRFAGALECGPQACHRFVVHQPRR